MTQRVCGPEREARVLLYFKNSSRDAKPARVAWEWGRGSVGLRVWAIGLGTGLVRLFIA